MLNPRYLLSLVVLAACSGPRTATTLQTRATASATGDPDAIAACQGLVQPPPPNPVGGPASVAAGFTSTVGQVNRWRKSYYAAIGWEPKLEGDPTSGQDVTSTAKETVCWLNGQWDASGPPGSGPFNQAVQIIGPMGVVMGDGVGPAGVRVIERPSDHSIKPVPPVNQSPAAPNS